MSTPPSLLPGLFPGLFLLLLLAAVSAADPTESRRVFRDPSFLADAVSEPSRPLLAGEARRLSLLTSPDLTDAAFDAEFDPQLPAFARLSHMLARFILRELPIAGIKGGYLRDTIINNEQPRDLDLNAPGPAHINNVVMNISAWARRLGLHVVGPFCLHFAGGCRGLHILACNKTSEDSECSTEADMLSVEVADSYRGKLSHCPLFAANMLTLTGGRGLSTLDPTRISVREAADAARRHELRQVGFGYSLKRVASKFLRRGWIQSKPFNHGEPGGGHSGSEQSKFLSELNDCNEWARKLKSISDHYQWFRSRHPLPKTPRRFRRLQSQKSCGPGEGWDLDNEDYMCKACPSGKFGATNRNDGICESCADGKFTRAKGADECESCPEGWQRENDENNGTACNACEAGSVQREQGQSKCDECAAGMFSPGTNLTECTECAEGKFSGKSAAKNCSVCPMGQVAAQQGLSNCKACDAGTYNNKIAAHECTPCPKGRYTGSVTGSQSVGACKECRTGKFKDDNMRFSAVCEDCPAGWFANVTKSEYCTLCEGGKFAASPGGKDTCKECPEGTYMPANYASEGSADVCLDCHGTIGSSRMTCEGCQAGKVGNNNFGCHRCESGFYSTGGNTCGDGDAYPAKCNESTVLSACQSCPSGFYGVEKRFHCVACPAGKWSTLGSEAPNASTCIPCTRGKYGELIAQTSEDACIMCGPGRHSASVGANHKSACASCESGFFAPDTANRWDLCVGCDPGRYQPDRGSFLPCQECEAGTSNPTQNASRCDRCLSGRHQPLTGQTECVGCRRGKFMALPGASGPCDECPAGFYGDTDGLSMCLSCSPGKHVSTRGASECKFCPKNEYASGTTECVPCPIGRTKRRVRTIECDPCSAGLHWGPGEGSYSNRTCIECVPGMYSRRPDSNECRVCPRGSFAPKSKAQGCLCCGIGRFRNSTNATRCLQCPEGFAQAPNEDQSDTFCSGLESCVPCLAGLYSPSVGMGACISCIGGRFNDASAQVHCHECAAGQFRLATMNATRCRECPTGWSQPTDGQVLCLPCAPGHFTDQIGRKTCTKCPVGWFARVPKSKECEPKEAGWIVTPGGATTVAVPLGSRIDASALSGFEACAVGTFGSDPPSDNCSSCPLGFDSFRGSTFCNPCSKGRFGTQSGCADCPTGYFQSESTEPQQTCDACPIGWTQNSTGESSCLRVGPTPESCGDSLFLDMSKRDNPEEWLCAPCPRGGHCAGSIFWENATHHNLRPLFGWWEIPPRERKLGTSVEDMFAECTFEPACLGAYNSELRGLQDQAMADAGLSSVTQNFTASCNVALGFEQPSRLCQRCADGFSRIGPAECVACSTQSIGGELGLVIVGLSLFVVGFAVLIWLRIRSYQHFNHVRRKKAAHSTIKRILLSHVQMLLLVLGLSVRWPRLLMQVMRLFSSLAAISPENTHAIECVFLSVVQNHAEFYYGVILTAAVAPLAAMGLLAVYWIVFAQACEALSCGVKLRGRAKRFTELEHHAQSAATPPATVDVRVINGLRPQRQTLTVRFVPSSIDVFVTSSVFLWYVILPSLLRLSSAMFRCRYVGQPSPGKSEYLVLDIEEACWQGQHLFVACFVAVPMLFLYGVVVPAYITAVLYQKGEARLTDPSSMLRWGLFHSG